MATVHKPRKPKFKAMPKAPKMTASAESWKRYNEKVSQVISENQKLNATFEKEKKAYETEMKNREKIKERARVAKSKM